MNEKNKIVVISCGLATVDIVGVEEVSSSQMVEHDMYSYLGTSAGIYIYIPAAQRIENVTANPTR